MIESADGGNKKIKNNTYIWNITLLEKYWEEVAPAVLTQQTNKTTPPNKNNQIKKPPQKKNIPLYSHLGN